MENENTTTENQNEPIQNENTQTQNETKDLKWYVNIVYQDKEWNYYINQKNFIDTIILTVFIFFFIFSFISLTIKFFNLWKN